MDLSVQASPVLSWRHNHHPLWTGRTRFSLSQLAVLARKCEHHGVIRCSAVEAGGETVEEKQVSEANAPEAANDVDSGSWLEGQGNSDPFFGWTSNGSQQHNANRIAGWMKIGGVVVLTLGFALGARSLHLRKDLAREFTVTPPATEETTGSLSKGGGVEETPQTEEVNESSEASENVTERSLEEETKQSNSEKDVSDVGLEEGARSFEETKQSNSEKDVSDVRLEGGVVRAPVSAQNMLAEDSSINDNCDMVSTSDTSGDAETSAAEDENPASPAVVHASAALEEDPSLDVKESGDFTDKGSNPLSTSGDRDTVKDVLGESDMPGRSTSEEAMLDESLSQDEYNFEDLQEEKTSALGEREILAREREYEKPTNGQHEWGGGEPSADFFGSIESGKKFFPATITAPSSPPEILASSFGEIVVPAHVDHMQEQILAALQALKVVEVDVKAGDICTRREYARWLMAASAFLTRSPAHKVLPAMYIENVSVLAYEDVTPQDQDFPFIQGLAEAGLLSSRLVEEDHLDGVEENSTSVFSPDSPLTRQDLVTWKVALERKPAYAESIPTSTGLMALQEQFGFIDLDKVHKDAWPALLMDTSAGEQSIVALAFGRTRRLQPQKPVTKGQAAVALATGEAWELVSEELARLEADSVAEAAVVAELALEAKAQKEVVAAFEKLVQVEREKHQASASMLESMQAELERIKAVHDTEKLGLLKDRAALDAEKELLSSAKLEVEQQALALSSGKLEVAFQQEQADKLRAEAEEERTLISKVRSELQIEKSALILARSWAEDEARKAQQHSRVLEQERRRWETQGTQVNDDKVLDTIEEKVENLSPSWQPNEGAEAQETAESGLVKEDNDESQAEQSPMKWLINESKKLGRMLVVAFLRFFCYLQLVFHATVQRSTDLFEKVRARFHEARVDCVNSTTKTVEGLKRSMPHSVAGLTSNVREGTLKVVDEWKGGAEKLSQKFKTS